jgi:predicted transcriptional regulator
MIINFTAENIKFFEALSSEVRVKIVELLNKKKMNITEIAEDLGLSSTIIGKHISKLGEAGIVKYETLPAKRGIQKLYSLQASSVLILFDIKEKLRNSLNYSIPVGQYFRYDVQPTCGLSSTAKLIGMLDDPRYFADPERFHAGIVWAGSGYLEYQIPNYILSNHKISSIEISMEICSEAPGYNEDWPSDITFYINDISIGTWTCPGCFGSKKGVLNPDWWPQTSTQYGLLKVITINNEATFIDGVKISDINVNNLNINFNQEILFKIESYQTSENSGGFCILGKGFGNYNQDLNATIVYDIV